MMILNDLNIEHNCFRQEKIVFIFLILGLLFCVFLFYVKRNRLYRSFTSIDKLVSIFLLYCVFHIRFCSDTFIDASTVGKWLAVVVAYVVARIIKNKKCLLFLLPFLGAEEAVMAIGQWMGCWSSNHSVFEVTGHWGNPALLGVFLVICLILTVDNCADCYKNKEQKKFIFFILLSVLQAWGVWLSQSRATVLALLVGCGVYCFEKFSLYYSRSQRNRVAIGYVLGLGLLTIVLYSFRPQSANARLLIWRVTTDIVIDNPLIGHGIGSFQWKYMKYQARYFSGAQRTENEILIANNVATPYNEWLHLLVELGAVGFLLAVGIFFFVFWHDCGNTAKAEVAAWGTFASFSYPSETLSLLCLLALLVGCMDCGKKRFYCHYGCLADGALIFVCLLAIVWAGWQLRNYRCMEVDLFDVLSQRRDMGKRVAETYYCSMKRNVTFSNLYHQWLTTHSSSTLDMEKAEEILPTSENFCKLGDYYLRIDRPNLAEETYLLASRMNPKQLRPIYKLWKFYLKNNDSTKAISEAHKLLSCPVKVYSSFTINARTDVLKYLKEKEKCSISVR